MATANLPEQPPVGAADADDTKSLPAGDAALNAIGEGSDTQNDTDTLEEAQLNDVNVNKGEGSLLNIEDTNDSSGAPEDGVTAEPESGNINNETIFASSGDFDLLGSPATEEAGANSPPVDAMDVFGFGASPPVESQPMNADGGPNDGANIDLLGMDFGETAASGDNPPSQPADETAKFQDSPAEKKDDDPQKESSSMLDAANPDVIGCPSSVGGDSTEGEEASLPKNEVADAKESEISMEPNRQGDEREKGEGDVSPPENDIEVAEDSEVPPPPQTDNGDENIIQLPTEGAVVDSAENEATISGGNNVEKDESLQPDNETELPTQEKCPTAEEQANPVPADAVDSQPTSEVGGTADVATSVAHPPLQTDTVPSENDVNSSGGNEKDPSAVTSETETVVERTAEEEEWLSMGLGLGDALRQIVALTEERDSALVICQEKDDGKSQAEALLVEVQSRLEAEMNRRAEYESKVKQVTQSLKAYEEKQATYEKMEDDLAKAEANLVTMVSEKSKIELEVQKLRDNQDESKQKEVMLSNRLNEAKKKEANKSTTAGRLEADNETLREELEKTKEDLDAVTKAKAKLESNMEKLKVKAVERVKQAETNLAEERELNEERKKKMKVFVETKAEELREAKESANEMQKELEETRSSLRSSRDREETFQTDLEAARLKYRELQREMERMKRSSEQVHRMGKDLEQELEKSASETEEHKKKRMSAKHEIMQMVRTLEAERNVSSKLRESVKFTFTPKALSQQELLNECLRDFQLELERLAAKTGKTLQPSPELTEQDRGLERTDSAEVNGSSKKSRRSKADMDTERLVANLEQETQQVSKGIMALSASIERMRSLLNEDMSCMAYFQNIIAAAGGTGEARHQRLNHSDDHEERAHSSDFV